MGAEIQRYIWYKCIQIKLAIPKDQKFNQKFLNTSKTFETSHTKTIFLNFVVRVQIADVLSKGRYQYINIRWFSLSPTVAPSRGRIANYRAPSLLYANLNACILQLRFVVSYELLLQFLGLDVSLIMIMGWRRGNDIMYGEIKYVSQQPQLRITSHKSLRNPVLILRIQRIHMFGLGEYLQIFGQFQFFFSVV